MRRLLALLALAVALPAVVVFGTAADDVGAGYEVRAIFDNAAATVPGEDVKIAGAKVGVIDSMDVTRDNKAALVLKIEDPRFTPFRGDASCTIRPQSLIGEKYVECDPGTAAEPELKEIADGEAGEGQHLLGLDSTSSPVDLDLVNNILRMPFRERFSILLAEFGTGLAGRGEDLNEVIRRANPALRETDRVLKILAGQNDVLAKLASDSDQALAPLAREKERVSSFIVEADETARATAERRDDIEAQINRLPGFLTELRPLMADLEGFATEATPVARDLNRAAPAVSRLLRELGPFSRAALPSIESLGDATVTGRPALLRARPLVRDLRSFARSARPLSVDLAALARSLDETGAIERIADYFFFQTLAINGFDGIGHYLRAGLLVNLCSTYTVEPAAGCNSNFTQTQAIGSASKADLDPALADASAILRGKGRSDEEPAAGEDESADEDSAGSVPPQGGILGGLLGDESAQERKKNLDRMREQAERPSPALEGSGDPLLDYLLGGGQ